MLLILSNIICYALGSKLLRFRKIFLQKINLLSISNCILRMMKMFLTKVRVLLKWEKDFLTSLEEFVYSKQKRILRIKHVFINKFFKIDQWRNCIKTAYLTFAWMERLLGSKSHKILWEELGYEWKKSVKNDTTCIKNKSWKLLENGSKVGNIT